MSVQHPISWHDLDGLVLDRDAESAEQADDAAEKDAQREAASAIRRAIPVRTFADWGDPPPGFVEADLVAHSGPSASGAFVQTLVLTDIATGWTEVRRCFSASRRCWCLSWESSVRCCRSRCWVSIPTTTPCS